MVKENTPVSYLYGAGVMCYNAYKKSMGRYVHKYHDEIRSAMETLIVAFAAIFIIFTVNLTASYVTVNGVGIRSPIYERNI